MRAEIEEQKKRKSGLSIFNGKGRKEVQQQIDELTREFEELENGLGKGLAEKQSALEEAEARAEKACSAVRNYTMLPLLREKARAIQKLRELGISEKELSKLNVPQTVEFGRYVQDKSGVDAPIEWLILELTPYRALLISKYALDCKPYNTSEAEVTWESCTLRKWLNEDFFNAAFSDGEKAMIPTVTVSADENPDCDTDPGNATQDRVFLLSIPEANRYFKNKEARMCVPTACAVGNGAYTEPCAKGGQPCCEWWLRSPGEDQDAAAIVEIDDDDDYDDHGNYGNYVHSGSVGVRPALWINLSD